MRNSTSISNFIILACGVTVAALLALPENSATSAQSSLSTAAQQPPQTVQTAEQVYKNIQVFKGFPASQLDSTMAFISGSLGVKCNHCHVNPFDKDEKPAKQTARRMIRMVFDLNKGTFAGQSGVSCYTCHRGSVHPIPVPAVGNSLWLPAPTPPKEAPLPTVDQVLDKYVQALGGVQALQKVTSRVAKGSRIGADGVLVPEDVYHKAPNKLLIVTSYPAEVFSTGFNGTAGWGRSSKSGVRELPGQVLAQFKTEAEFYKEIKFKELYSKLTVVGKTSIGESEAYVIEPTPFEGSPEKLYFDTRTGLLVRRYLESPTILGMSPLQTDYEDYREVDGVNQPFLIHWSIPGRRWGRKIAEIKQNVAVDDAQFNPPSPPAK